MGGLSKKRMKTRIVRKSKVKNRKIILARRLDPQLAKHWDEKKTRSQNFEALGLQSRLAPSLKHSKVGRQLVKEEHHRRMAYMERMQAAAEGAEQGDDGDEAGEEELQEGDFEAKEEPAKA